MCDRLWIQYLCLKRKSKYNQTKWLLECSQSDFNASTFVLRLKRKSLKNQSMRRRYFVGNHHFSNCIFFLCSLPLGSSSGPTFQRSLTRYGPSQLDCNFGHFPFGPFPTGPNPYDCSWCRGANIANSLLSSLRLREWCWSSLRLDSKLRPWSEWSSGTPCRLNTSLTWAATIVVTRLFGNRITSGHLKK